MTVTLHQSSMPKPVTSRESRILPTSPAFDAPVRRGGGVTSEYCHNVWYGKTILWDKKLHPFHSCRAMRCMSAAYAVMRCLSVCVSVCVSVTFVSSVKTNKVIFNIFSPSCSHTTLVFPYQKGWRYSDGNPLTANAGGVSKNRDSEPVCLLLTLQQARCCKHGPWGTTATISQVVTIISLVVYCGYSTTKRHAR